MSRKACRSVAWKPSLTMRMFGALAGARKPWARERDDRQRSAPRWRPRRLPGRDAVRNRGGRLDLGGGRRGAAREVPGAKVHIQGADRARAPGHKRLLVGSWKVDEGAILGAGHAPGRPVGHVAVGSVAELGEHREAGVSRPLSHGERRGREPHPGDSRVDVKADVGVEGLHVVHDAGDQDEVEQARLRRQPACDCDLAGPGVKCHASRARRARGPGNEGRHEVHRNARRRSVAAHQVPVEHDREQLVQPRRHEPGNQVVVGPDPHVPEDVVDGHLVAASPCRPSSRVSTIARCLRKPPGGPRPSG